MINAKELSDLLKEITILYVEDDTTAQNVTIETLSKFSSKILTASNGQEAFEIYKKNEIQLIISDVEMPFMDGITFISYIRKIDVSIPIIIISAHCKDDYLFACANLNTQAYILKPVNFDKLKDALYKVAHYLNLTLNILITINQNLKYNKNQATLIEDEKQHKLNNKEKLLLELLIENKNKIVPYSQIEQNIWYDYDDVMSQSALRTVIKNLRKKSSTKFIENVSGCGYIIKTSTL